MVWVYFWVVYFYFVVLVYRLGIYVGCLGWRGYFLGCYRDFCLFVVCGVEKGGVGFMWFEGY